MKIIVCVTGASGALYVEAFLKQCHVDKYLIVSKWGKALLKDELNLHERDLLPYVKKIYSDDDLTAPPASGTNKFDAMVVLPCSISTLGKIASGIGDTLITRTAQVALKERWKMILCLRETPLSTLALEQAAKLSSYGVTIMPLSPAFYFHPQTIDNLVDNVVEKLLGLLSIREPKGWRAEELE